MKVTLPIAALLAAASAAPAVAETVNCTNITSLPTTITVQGIYCLKQDLATNITSGNAITIATNNVTIDFNGFKLGGLGAGPNTQANGVVAENRQNITLRNGNVRGFRFGIAMVTSTASSGHVIEDNLIDGNTVLGIYVSGSGVAVRRNRIVNTDSTPPSSPGLSPARFDAESEHADMGVAGLANVAPMAGQGGTAFGIYVTSLTNSEISDNFIANTVSSGNQALGIFVTVSANVTVARNTILGTRSLDGSRAIVFVQTTPADGRLVVTDNVVSGASQSVGDSVGIRRSTNGIMYCSNNVVDGFNLSTEGCTAEQGTFPASGP